MHDATLGTMYSNPSLKNYLRDLHKFQETVAYSLVINGHYITLCSRACSHVYLRYGTTCFKIIKYTKVNDKRHNY